MPVLSNTSLVRIEQGVAIAIWAAAACGFGWAMNPQVVSTGDVVTFVASATFWLPLFAVIVQAPLWMTRWANDPSDGSPKLRVQQLPPKGRYLFMDANLLQPIESHLILPPPFCWSGGGLRDGPGYRRQPAFSQPSSAGKFTRGQASVAAHF